METVKKVEQLILSGGCKHVLGDRLMAYLVVNSTISNILIVALLLG